MSVSPLFKTAVAVAALACASFQAQAVTSNIGAVTSGAPTSFNAATTTAGPFSDIFTFTLPTAGSVGFSVINFPVTGFFNSILTSASLFSNTDGTLFNADDKLIGGATVSNNKITFASAPLGSGSYYLNVSGIANGPQGGLYNGAVSVTAVPEPETYAMLLAGLGVMGFIARRRNKTL